MTTTSNLLLGKSQHLQTRPDHRHGGSAEDTGNVDQSCDEDITPLDTTNDPPLVMQGPITRARARQLNLEVSSFLSTSLYDYENRLLPNDYIVIRNNGEGQGMLGDGLGVMEDQQGQASEEGGPNQVGLGSVSRARNSLH
jgi:hypothetical protein